MAVHGQGRGFWSRYIPLSLPCRFLPGLAVLDLPWDYHLLGLLADGCHLPHLRMVCFEGKGGKQARSGTTTPSSMGGTIPYCPWSHGSRHCRTQSFASALVHIFPFQIVPTYERMIIFRLGRIRAPQGPGVVLLLPFIDHWQRVDLRTRAFNVPPCKVSCLGPQGRMERHLQNTQSGWIWGWSDPWCRAWTQLSVPPSSRQGEGVVAGAVNPVSPPACG